MNRMLRRMSLVGAAGALAAATLGVTAGTANAATCPSTGAACFYWQTNFNDDRLVYYPNSGYKYHQAGIIGVRNRAPYTVCLLDPYGDYVSVQPGGYDSDIRVLIDNSDLELYFHGTGTTC
ncbi:MAG TPA: hypothetical protein VG756_01860 [Pseudonocardiaceae bacterium]|jgi:hypothetical protein|nr:hypothetical protein [Pseudonocardiaceae bacterium]